jgi:hypothetical protein
MPAALVVAGVGAAASVGGAAIGAKANKKAAKKAANAQIQASQETNALARENRDINIANLGGYNKSGIAANERINAMLGLGGDKAAADNAFASYRDSTGYQFRFDQGNRALASQYRARGVSQSGAAQKANIQYGQNIGSQEFGNHLGQLGNQQGVGLGAASAIAGVGNNYVNTLAQTNQNRADAIGNSALVGAANTNALIGGATSALSSVLGQSSLGSSYNGGGFNGGYGGGTSMGGEFRGYGLWR